MLLNILLAIPAVLILLAAMAAAVRLVAAMRRRDYVRHEDKASKDIRARLALPEFKPEAWPKALEPIAQRFRATHQKAVDEQTRYHAAVVRSATCLALTFSAVAFSTTRLYGNHWVHVLIVWIEVLALIALFINWRAGTRANRAWIAQRIQAELLRQDQFIGLLVPETPSAKLSSGIEAGRIAIGRYAGLEVVEAINTYWASRRQALAAAPVAAADLSGAALLRYLHTRPVRQLGWFSDSIARLQHNAHARERRLRALFTAALVLAVGKLVLALRQGGGEVHHEATGADFLNIVEAMLSPCLIIVTGWSATEAAYYLNQNARSLVHRYRNQLARMGHWFDRAKSELPLDRLPAADLDEAGKQSAKRLVLEFEDLMIEELIDWIYIAKLDALEIAP